MLSPSHAWPLDAAELRPALRLVIALARADMGVLLLHDDDAGTLLPVLGEGLDPEQCVLLGTHAAKSELFGRAMERHHRVRLRNAWSDGNGLGKAAKTLGFRDVECLPFFRRDARVLGAFAMLFRHQRGSRHQVCALQEFCADLVACTLTHAYERAESERARERVARTSEERIALVARLSHELRTPLQSIVGYVGLLRGGAAARPTPEQDRMLARIGESEHVLVHLIDELITFSRIEAGRVTYQLSAVDAADALHAVERMVLPLAIDHDIGLVVDAPRECVAARADGDKLHQILINLAANAVKFTARGGTITLRARGDGAWVMFDVQDTGLGIAHNRLHEIFEPYVQVAEPVTASYGGSGLGLAISREFAAGMNGELRATSEVGRGSTFTLRLPRSEEKPAAGEPVTRSAAVR